jgi:hypothetical protein
MWLRWPDTEFATEIGVKIHLPALKKQVVQRFLFSDITVFSLTENMAANP